jgi:hypothetical protein
MKNEDLLKLKIDIQVENDTSFLELATLLDKPEFLHLLPTLRKEYDIKKLTSIDDFYSTVDAFTLNEDFKINFSKYENSKQLIAYAKDNSSGHGDPERPMDKYQLIDTESNLLCYLFKRPPYFDEPIKHAIYCGMVNDSSMRTTSVMVVEGDRLYSTVSEFSLPSIAILVSPATTDRVIKDAMSVARTLYKTDKRLSYYKPRTDKANKIRNYREWYWMHLGGMKYVDIADEWSNRPDIDSTDSGIDDNRILKGINYYTKLLSM